MRAKIKRFHSPDVDLNSFAPEDPTKVGFVLQLMVGPETGDGEESFDVTVCTAEWLRERYADRPVVSLRHHVLISEYHYQALTTELSRLVQRCVGETWSEVANQVARIGHWELKDYRE